MGKAIINLTQHTNLVRLHFPAPPCSPTQTLGEWVEIRPYGDLPRLRFSAYRDSEWVGCSPYRDSEWVEFSPYGDFYCPGLKDVGRWRSCSTSQSFASCNCAAVFGSVRGQLGTAESQRKERWSCKKHSVVGEEQSFPVCLSYLQPDRFSSLDPRVRVYNRL